MKKRTNNFFKNLLKKTLHGSMKIKTSVACFLIFVTLIFIFPAGAFATSTQVEVCAQYFTEIASFKVKDSRHHSALIVESKDEKKNPMINTYSEFHSLYGAFREDRASFVGTVNANRENTIYFKDSRISNNNLAFMYAESGFNNTKYKDAYKHEFYPIQLMFKGEHRTYPGSYSFLYISESHANSILDTRNQEHTQDNYYSLLGTIVTLTMNGVDYDWLIEDIYFQTNYFYDDLTGVVGEFLFGYNKYPEGFKKQSLYFMCNQDFQNEYYIEYSKKQYDSEKYNYKYLTYNLNDGTRLNQTILNNAINNKNEIGTIFLSILSILFGLVSIVYILATKLYERWNLCLFLLIPLFLPYLLFKLIHLLSNSILLFSSFSVVFNMIVVLFISLSLLIFMVVFRTIKKKGVELDGKDA